MGNCTWQSHAWSTLSRLRFSRLGCRQESSCLLQPKLIHACVKLRFRALPLASQILRSSCWSQDRREWSHSQSSIRSRGAGSSHPMDPGAPVQNQNFTRNPKEASKSSWNPRGSLKSFTLTFLWNSAKLVKISPGIIERLHHADRRQMRLLKEQCAE